MRQVVRARFFVVTIGKEELVASFEGVIDEQSLSDREFDAGTVLVFWCVCLISPAVVFTAGTNDISSFGATHPNASKHPQLIGEAC